MRSAQLKKILILVTLLAVPGFLYYLLQEKGKNRYRPLPIFGPKTVASTFHQVRGEAVPDTLYHLIEDFNLQNQSGATLNWDALKGKVVLFGLFRAANPQTDASSKALQKYAGTFAKNDLLRLLSITVDPVEEKVSFMSRYAAEFGAHAGKWDLLTGDSAAVNKLIRQGLFLDAFKTSAPAAETAHFTYSDMLVLVDSEHRIRGYYEASSSEALSKLDDEIKVLIVEELRNMKDGR